MATRVWYETHSTTLDNEAGVATGWLPGELSEVGRQQALTLARRIDHRKPDVIFCSDLARAVQTGEIVAARLGLAVTTRVGLREFDVGEHLGVPLEEDPFADTYGRSHRWRDATETAIRAWGAQRDVPIVDLKAAVADEVTSGRGNPDGIHWNFEAHRNVADLMLAALAAAGVTVPSGR